MQRLTSDWLAETVKRKPITVLIGTYIFFQLTAMLIPVAKGLQLHISQESMNAAILVSILSVWVLIGLFTYLNRYTKRRYFTLWTVAWLFHGLWLSLTYGLMKFPDNPLLMTAKQVCVGVAATFLLWGSFRFLGLRVRQTLLSLFMAFIVAWSYIGNVYLDSAVYLQVPIFGLIGAASVLTAFCFFRYRKDRGFIGATLLGFGFLFWGGYSATYPLFQTTDDLAASGFFISAVLQLFIAVSMIILVLEEVRYANQMALTQLRSQRLQQQALKMRVISTEERYRDLFDQASEAIVIGSAEDMRVLELNAAAQRLLGISRKDAPEHSLISFCQPMHANCIPPKGSAEWYQWATRQRTVKVIRRNGETAVVDVEGSPIEFEGRLAYQFFLREATDRTRLEQQLRHAEKMSALGQMISGVAHELNNPLAVIKGYIELMLAHHDLPPRTRADLEKVAQESTRAAKLVRSFLAFAREQPAQREMVDLNDLIRRVADLRKFELAQFGTALELDLAVDLPRTYADPDQIQQIVNNLITNSVQAMENHPKPHRVRVTTAQTGEVLQITVEDNGPGIPAGLEEKIFQPFFTTKQAGVGTGLGLSIAHSIMTDHRGRIFYQRAALGGAAFVLEFPIVEVEEAPRRDTNVVPLPPRASVRRARVLVLDDEKTIAELLSEMLGMLGHEPTVCTDPATALQAIERQDFHLIISDFRMPGMDGKEFHAAVLKIKPAMAHRIIFLSGDVASEGTAAFLAATGNPHLSKPFHLSTLEAVVTNALSEPRLGDRSGSFSA